MKECYAAELRSIDFYLANSEEEFLQVVLEKLGKYKIESKKRLQQQNRTRKMDQLSSMKQQFGGHTDNKK